MFNDMRGNWSQRSSRRDVTFKDQHGRKYHASIEVKTGDPSGIVQAGYQAPLTVPLMYLERARDPERPYDLYVNYERWIKDVRSERADYEKQARQIATRRYGSEYDVNKPLPADVLEIIGPVTQHVEPIIAAKQGNRWVLGFTPVIDQRLAKYFPRDVIDPGYSDEPDFRDDPLDATLTVEEQFDPQATGGKKIQVGRSKEAERKAAYRARKRAAAPDGDDDVVAA